MTTNPAYNPVHVLVYQIDEISEGWVHFNTLATSDRLRDDEGSFNMDEPTSTVEGKGNVVQVTTKELQVIDLPLYMGLPNIRQRFIQLCKTL